MWRFRGRQRSKTTKIRHNGKFKNGKPVPPVQVLREVRKLEAQLDRGRDHRSETVAVLLQRVHDQYTTAEFSSLPSLNSRIEHLNNFFATMRGERILKTDIIDYASQRKKEGAANKTVNNELQMLFKAMRLVDIAIPNEWKELMLKNPPPRAGFFDDAMIAAVFGHLPAYLRRPVLCGYMTGWRKEEILQLKRTDLDLDTGELRLWTSKNELARVFPIDVVPGLRELLTEALADSAPDPASAVPLVQPYLFIHKRTKRYGGQMHRIVDMRKAWKTACTAAGYPGMLFHDLRRSTARNMETMGWPRSCVMQWCGWETESMFHRYQIRSAADRQMVSARMHELRELTAGHSLPQAQARLQPTLEQAAQLALTKTSVVSKVLAMPKRDARK